MINIKIKMINNNKILIIIEITNDLNNNLFILSPPYLMYNGDDNHTSNNNLLSIANSLIQNTQKVNNKFTKKQYCFKLSLSNCLGYFYRQNYVNMI